MKSTYQLGKLIQLTRTVFFAAENLLFCKEKMEDNDNSVCNEDICDSVCDEDVISADEMEVDMDFEDDNDSDDSDDLSEM